MSAFSHTDTCPICRSGTTFIAIAGPFLAFGEAARGAPLMSVAFAIVSLVAWIEWGMRHREDGKTAGNLVVVGYIVAGALMLINDWLLRRG